MRRLTFETRTAIIFGAFFTVVLVIVGFTFSTLYYAVVERDLKDNAYHQAVSISKEHIYYDKNIFFKKDESDQTLSSHLRDNDSSAIIFDNNLNKIGMYGVFRTLANQNLLEKSYDPEKINNVLNRGENVLYYSNLHENKKYLVILFPIKSNNKVVGVLELAKEADFISRILLMNSYLLLLLLPLSILAGWIASYQVTKNIFQNFDNILATIARIQKGNLSERIAIQGNPKDQFVNLAHTFNQMLDKIQEGVKKQKNFISLASHELKTPLAQAVSSLDVAAISLKDGKMREAYFEIELVRQDILSLGERIDSYLKLSKINGNSSFKKDALDMKEEIENIVKKNHEEIVNKDIEVLVDCQQKVTAYVSKEHFNILFSNVLSNAIKYSFTGGKINISVFCDDKKAGFVVMDEGVGIEKSDIRHIFNRFFRGKKVRTKMEGFGVGLSIVKEICDLNDLKISVGQLMPRGTKVVVAGFELCGYKLTPGVAKL